MKTALVIGGGPAGLMAAQVLSERGAKVTIVDAKPSLGRKFLMAGKSGLNLTKSEPLEPFLSNYSHQNDTLRASLSQFGPDEVQAFARDLGQEIFTGSTGRVFPTSMKASPLLRAWLSRLTDLGITIQTRWRWTGWNDAGIPEFDTPTGPQTLAADSTVLACGGASWARLGSDGGWAQWVEATPFKPANVGLRVTWSDHMTQHFGTPIKSVIWCAGDTQSRGEAVLAAQGLEGGGIYSVSQAVRDGARLSVDLLPDLSAQDIAERYSRKRKKDTWSKWARQALRLSPVKQALLRDCVGPANPEMGADWTDHFKALHIPVTGTFDLDSAISTAGGVPFEAITESLMLKDRPGVFCAGEMLDWEAPTGGYLLTACFATGRTAGNGAADYLGL